MDRTQKQRISKNFRLFVTNKHMSDNFFIQRCNITPEEYELFCRGFGDFEVVLEKICKVIRKDIHYFDSPSFVPPRTIEELKEMSPTYSEPSTPLNGFQPTIADRLEDAHQLTSKGLWTTTTEFNYDGSCNEVVFVNNEVVARFQGDNANSHVAYLLESIQSTPLLLARIRELEKQLEEHTKGDF